MSFLKKIWEWLSGNKTAIGGFLLALAISGLIENQLIVDILTWVGTFLGGIGLVHKAIKPADANS